MAAMCRCPDIASGILVRKQIWAKSEHNNNRGRENKINKNMETASVVSTAEKYKNNHRHIMHESEEGERIKSKSKSR